MKTFREEKLPGPWVLTTTATWIDKKEKVTYLHILPLKTNFEQYKY